MKSARAAVFASRTLASTSSGLDRPRFSYCRSRCTACRWVSAAIHDRSEPYLGS